MKDKKNLFCLFVILVLIFSLRLNIKNFRNQKRARKIVINNVYSNLYSSLSILDKIILNNDINLDEEKSKLLTNLAIELFKLNTIIHQNGIYFEKPIYYPGITSFDFIAETLLDTEIGVNGVQIYGVLNDKFVSENEIEYLEQLRDDIKIVVENMVSSENPPQPNDNLSIVEVNRILENFFKKWRNTKEDSPYMLLTD